jgi:HAD superfamily hydrolase (TIGR01509 family)
MTRCEFQGSLIAGVIFDHDGVLVDSELLAMEIITRLLNENGIESTVSEAFTRHLGRGFESVTERISVVNPDMNANAYADMFHKELFSAFSQSLTSIPGIAGLVENLRSIGIPIAIGSSGTRKRVELGIGITSLDEYFTTERIVTREDVTHGKPEPDIFLLAAQRLGVPPENCLVIEDSPHGVTAAQRAGMKVIGLSLRTSPESLLDADGLVTDAAEIWDLISPLNFKANVHESA